MEGSRFETPLRQDIFSSSDPDNGYNESSDQGVALTIHSHNNENVSYLKYWLLLLEHFPVWMTSQVY